jgi:phosphopantothenoylcysteine synthetase/decarboxylase
MHPETANTIAQLAAGMVLAIVTGIAEAAAHQPEAALLTAGACYIAHQIRTHRPRTARAHP